MDFFLFFSPIACLMAINFASSLFSAQDLETKTNKVIKELDTVLSDLQWHITWWKTLQLYECVSRKPEGIHGENPDDVEAV